ncbi:hypothetical protein WMY93_025911 [Mugilogobius chulae]|uniref:non-specific serine/threonine protein kinase n=1 Tax=Mugilogobius chulae TaxID=88201 RepID=A0AAW0N087_9GOBI
MRPHCWVMVVLAGIMSYLSPERALGAPQREVAQSRVVSLSPPPYVVILISCSGLVSFVLLLLTCLCCKRGGVGFNEFDNAEGEECSGGSSPIQEDSLSSCPSLPEVYTLPVRDRPKCQGPHAHDTSDPKSQCFKRHSLNYLQEIGNGWFGKVILAEVLCDCSSSQAVVKELRVSASPLEQRKFLAESEPYRSLKHPNILQCLGQCSESIPYLLVMEFCQLGDLKRYLRAQRKSDGMTPELPTRDLLTLQRMAFEITSGLLHLHENNYIHSDLALRNCLLTSDLTVRIGDYGLSHNHYKEDYYLTPDKLWIPLRWIAPELLEEYRGSLIVTDQTKTSNVWSLGWYEIMQSCWLPSSQRPAVAEIFLLLSSLLAAEGGTSRARDDDEEDEEFEEGRRTRGESEESFERRWDLLRPPAFQIAANERHREFCRDDRDNSYPLLDPVGNCITPTSTELDDILTVTETSKGLNFEGYKPLPPPQPIPNASSNHSRQSLDTPTVVPVISARSPSLASEYYIRLEEHTPQDRSPTLKAKSTSRSNSACSGDVELVEIRSGMLGKEQVPYCSEKCGGGIKGIQTIRSSEIQIQVPRTGVAEFKDVSSRVTDFSIVDLGDDEEEDRKRSQTLDNKSVQAPVLPPKPRSMSMSSGTQLHSRPLPAPPTMGYRGLPLYNMSGKIETDPLHVVGSCPPSTLDHLGFIAPDNHPIYPMCPPPLPPHSKQGFNNNIDSYSRYRAQSLRDPLTSDLSEREGNMRYSAKEATQPRAKNFESPMRRENPLRPIYRNIPRPQNQDLERQSSSSPTYSDEDDSPFGSPDRFGGTTIAHSSLSEDADPASSEPFSRGMKRTQSRLDTILPAIWKEDAELQAAARKSPMHLFLTEISSVAEAPSKPKSEVSTEEDRRESWGSFVFPNRGMRRSQSLLTELSGQSNTDEAAVVNDPCQGDLFLTEVDTGSIEINIEDEASNNDSVKYLYPGGPRLHPYVYTSEEKSYKEAEDVNTKAMPRSRSLLSEMTSEKPEEPKRTEMTREEFLKEIQSAETFLTEIMSRQNAANNKKEVEHSPILLSPEYETICIDPDAAQTIRFQTNKGKDDTHTEAIYAQVTKRAKKCDAKMIAKPDIPVLHISSNNSLENQEHNEATHCQSADFVFSEIMPKNGLLHNQTVSSPEKDEDSSEAPALPARGVDNEKQLTEELDTVIMQMNELLLTSDPLIDNGEIVKNGTSPKREEKLDNATLDSFQNDSEHSSCRENDNNDCSVSSYAGTPSTPDWDRLSSSLMTPSDSVLSPMTSSSAGGLTPSDSWSGGGGSGGGNGFRPLGPETLHRDSAYFSDSDWEGDGTKRCNSEGVLMSRPCNGRGTTERAALSGIEERNEDDLSEKSPFKSSHKSEQKDGVILATNKNGLSATQSDETGNFQNKTTLSEDPQTRSQCSIYISYRRAEMWRDGSVDKEEENRRLHCSQDEQRKREQSCQGRIRLSSLFRAKPNSRSDENDQWASPEKRSQDAELKSEFFTGFSNSEWGVRERIVICEEFWEENDELAGSEPHPTALENEKDTNNHETEAYNATGVKQKLEQQMVLGVQQEENMEDLSDSSNVQENDEEILNVEIENVEIPERETIGRCKRSREGLESEQDTENHNFNQWPQDCIQNDEQVLSEISDMTRISIFVRQTDQDDLQGIENVESFVDPNLDMRPAKQCEDDSRARVNSKEGFRDMSFEFQSRNVRMQDISETSQDNFSSVDFPSPPQSIDLDVQDEKSLDESFPSPPPSVSEEFITNMNWRSLNEDSQSNTAHKTDTTQEDANPIPKLLISEWKDLDEEPLEDFEKLEKLCCISEDEDDLFLGDLELLESLKKNPNGGTADNCEEACGAESEENAQVETQNEEDMSSMASHSKTVNGLMKQICEERLQFSLSENVKTNMLLAETLKDTTDLQTLGEQIAEAAESESNGEMFRDPQEEEEESQENQEAESSAELREDQTEENQTEPLTVIEQPEITPTQQTTNQAMKAKLARLSLALPPLAVTLPPTRKGFRDGAIGSRLGRRRGLSPGSDQDEDDEDEQEDESSRRVIVVTETDTDKRVGLRSLLKSPKEPLDRPRDIGRNVSFFDDVTIYLFDQETPTNELSVTTPTGPPPVTVKNSKLDVRGPNAKRKDSKRKEEYSIKPRSPLGTNTVTSSRFTVSPADDPHLRGRKLSELRVWMSLEFVKSDTDLTAMHRESC